MYMLDSRMRDVATAGDTVDVPKMVKLGRREGGHSQHGLGLSAVLLHLRVIHESDADINS